MDVLLGQIAETHQELIAELNEQMAVEWFRDRDIRFRVYKILIGRLMKARLTDEQEHLKHVHTFLQG